MTHLIDMSALHATERLADWQTALRAENKRPGTVAVYADGAARYLHWCNEHDHLPMSRAALNQWIAGLLDAGAHQVPPASASSPYAASPPGSPPAARSTSTPSPASRHPASSHR